MKHISLGELRGQRIGVDANVWVHRGTYVCASELVLGQPTYAYALYCKKLCLRLREFGVYPVLVFDGRAVPAKAATRRKRQEGRASARRSLDESIDVAREIEARLEGNPHDQSLKDELGQARVALEKAAQRTVEVTDAMIMIVINMVSQLEGVEVLRAPYEADAQLAHLAMNKLVAAVMTEDSDLIVYACPRLLYKFDYHSGTAQQLEWNEVIKISPQGSKSKFSLKGFSPTMFMHMCLLLGVDYLEGIKGIGIITANQLICRLKDGLRAIKHLQVNRHKGITVPADYEQQFRAAEVPSLTLGDLGRTIHATPKYHT